MRRVQPDVVIMDLAMPELNGVEATLRIRESSLATKVIILSMYSTNEHIFRALQAGARGYVLKESAGKEVVNAIRAVHSGRSYFSQQMAETMIGNYGHLRKDAQKKEPLEEP